MRPVVILFAKAPVPGLVKTRLQLTPADGARLHEAIVLDMLEKIGMLRDEADLELHTDAATAAWPDTNAARKLQAAGDLGAKLLHAIGNALGEKRPQAVVVGSDSPTLPVEYLRALLHSPADVALGPCEDGGYYAIACRRMDRRMFRGVQWSTPLTLDQTIAAARDSGLSVELVPRWWDVDEPADLARLAADPDLPRHARAVLQDRPAAHFVTGPSRSSRTLPPLDR